MFFTSFSMRCQIAANGKNFAMIDSSQIRAARALLDWRQTDLARASGVGVATIQRIEKSEGHFKSNLSTILRLRETLEGAGVFFIDADDHGGVGVRRVTRSASRKKPRKSVR
jgi:transcriptional regulator with XRE-family HTH domain